jgi:hypothetical protein
MKVARRYEEGVKLHQAYIDVLLRLAGYRLSDLYTSILAHSSYYGTLDKEVKERIAGEFNTSIQVISNGITRLRKMGILEKNIVNPRLCPTSKQGVTLTLVLSTGNGVTENKAENAVAV